jgi:lysophospholipase L1-like esterase
MRRCVTPNRALLIPALILLGSAGAAEQPVPQSKPAWMARHQQKVQEIGGAAPELIFVGDSITQELEVNRPQFGDVNSVWRRYYECRNAFNLGFAGDTTGNALWRLDHGEIDGIHPRLAVVLIGTNDVGARRPASPDQAAAGVQAVVQALHQHLPSTRILVVGLLPREHAETEREAVNALLARINWGQFRATYTAADQALLRDGTPDPALYRETKLGRPLLHPNAAGWANVAQTIEPKVAALLGDHRAPQPGGGVCAG